MVHRRRLALLLCVFLVFSGVSPSLATQDTSVPINQPSQAAVDAPSALSVSQERGNYTSPSVIVTDALGMGYTSIRANLTRNSLQTRLDSIDTEERRREVLSNATESLAEATARLMMASQQARQQYRQGDLSTQGYSGQLARINNRAKSLISTATFIEDRAPADSQLQSRAVELRANLVMFTGPVRNRIQTAIASSGGPERVYIGVGENGTATAIIEDGTYIREAVNPQQYDSASGSIPDAEPLLENVRQQYPWVMNQSAGVSFTPIPIGSNVPQYAYRLMLTYPSGTVNAYVDTSTDDVYQEVQRIQLDATTVSPDISFTRDGYTLTVSRSYAGGPMRVNMTTTDGAPVDAELLVNNRSAGQTGGDGVRWLVTPSENYNLTAVLGNEEIRITDIQPALN